MVIRERLNILRQLRFNFKRYYFYTEKYKYCTKPAINRKLYTKVFYYFFGFIKYNPAFLIMGSTSPVVLSI